MTSEYFNEFDGEDDMGDAGVVIQNEDGYPIDAARLKQAAQQVLKDAGAALNSELTVVITDDTTVAAYNQQYRDLNAPTDVLSFPAELPEHMLSEFDEADYLGDLVIAYGYASAQAKRENHDLSDSLCLLVVHGTLHLLGYDHDTLEHKTEMWAAQSAALRALDIDPAIVPTLEGNLDDDDDGMN